MIYRSIQVENAGALCFLFPTSEPVRKIAPTSEGSIQRAAYRLISSLAELRKQHEDIMKRRIHKAPRYAKARLPDDIVALLTDLTQATDLLGSAIVALSEGTPSRAQARSYDAAYLLYGVLHKLSIGGKTAELLTSELPRAVTIRVIKHTHENLDALVQSADESHKSKPTAV